jgi:hypothetical protein
MFSAMLLLGEVLWRQGNYTQAEKLLRKVHDYRKAVLGLEHGETLRSMMSLGCIYGHQKGWKEAAELQVQVVQSAKKLGDDDLRMKAMYNLPLSTPME